MDQIKSYIKESIKILNQINLFSIFKAIKIIKNCRSKKGRIFFAGSGGGAYMQAMQQMILEKYVI